MADVKWIKITTDIFDDEKILLIESLPDAYSIIVVWFKLLCLAGKQNNSGVFLMGRIAYTDKMLATIFRMKESTVSLALRTFEEFGMIEVIDGVITIPKWGKHQSLDQLEKKRISQREYMKAYREKQKLLASNDDCKANGKANGKANVSRPEEDIERERELEEEREDIYSGGAANNPPKPSKPPRSRFSPPTVEEVRAYCIERVNNVDPDRFVDYYSSNGWMVGKSKMKDWKAAVRTWEKNDRQPTVRQPQYSRQSKADELDAFYRMSAEFAEGS